MKIDKCWLWVQFQTLIQTDTNKIHMYVKIVRNLKTRKIKNSMPISKFTVIIHEELISKSLFWHHKCLMNGMLRVERDTQRSS